MSVFLKSGSLKLLETYRPAQACNRTVLPPHTKIHENPCDGGRVVPCGRADRQIKAMKLIDVFRFFAKAPKIDSVDDFLQT